MVQCFIINSYKSAQKMSTVPVLKSLQQEFFHKNQLPDAQMKNTQMLIYKRCRTIMRQINN